MSLQNLTDIHSRWNAEGIQNDFNRRAIRQVRHLLFRKNASDDALVAVAAGHLVADRQFPLHRDEHLDHLDDAGRQLITFLQLLDVFMMKLLLNLHLSFRSSLDVGDLGLNIHSRAGHFDLAKRANLELLQLLTSELRALCQKLLVLVNKIVGEPLAFEQLEDSLVALVFQNSNFVADVLLELFFFRALNRKRALILLRAFSGEHLHIDHGTVDARRASEARVANIARLLAEYRAKKFFFCSQLSLALRRDLSYQNRSRPDLSA